MTSQVRFLNNCDDIFPVLLGKYFEPLFFEQMVNIWAISPGGTLRYLGGWGMGAYARYQNFKIPLKY